MLSATYADVPMTNASEGTGPRKIGPPAMQAGSYLSTRRTPGPAILPSRLQVSGAERAVLGLIS